MILFLDSSFCVPLYVEEGESDLVTRTIKNWDGQVCISAFGEIEVTNAFRLRVFRGQIGEAEGAGLQQSFEDDLRTGALIVEPTTSVVLARAKRLSLEHTAEVGTRSLDIIHVAAALAAGAEQFASFDMKQRTLAKRVGLKVTPRSLG